MDDGPWIVSCLLLCHLRNDRASAEPSKLRLVVDECGVDPCI